MGAAISKVSKAAETGLKSASKKASKSLRSSRYVSSDILPIRSKTETKASQAKDSLSRHMLSKQAVSDALRPKDGVLHADGSHQSSHAPKGKHALEESERQPVQAAQKSAAGKAEGSYVAHTHRHSQKRRAHTPGVPASQQAEHKSPSARRNEDAAHIRGASDTRRRPADSAESALPEYMSGELAHAANSLGSSRALHGPGPSSSSFPLLPGASSVAAQYDSLDGGDWRLGTAPDMPPMPPDRYAGEA